MEPRPGRKPGSHPTSPLVCGLSTMNQEKAADLPNRSALPVGASVGIAEAAAPKKRIPLSSRNGELSEKAGFGCRGDRLSGPGKGRLGAGGTVWEKNPARRSRLEANRCILATPGRPKN
jgi:hypothetical protein